MQWLKGIITALVITLFTTALLSAFQRPIADYFAPDRLSATVETGPWYPLIKGEDAKHIPEATGLPEGFSSAFMDEDYSIARVTLENRSPKTISEIRFRYIGISQPYVVVSDGDKATYDFKGQIKALSLPDLKPGQSVKVYMWLLGGFGYPTYFDEFKTYSSEGPWRVEMKSPKTLNDELQLSSFSRFILDWGDIVLFVGLIALVVAIGAWGATHAIYATDLLSDARFYEAERQRYDADPKKFKVLGEGLGTFTQAHTMERRRAAQEKQSEQPADSPAPDGSSTTP